MPYETKQVPVGTTMSPGGRWRIDGEEEEEKAVVVVMWVMVMSVVCMQH